MSWQQASPDGGPLEPLTWATVGATRDDLDARLDARIAEALRERASFEEQRRRLREVDLEIAAIRSLLQHSRATVLADLLGSPLDLPRALITLLRLLLSPGVAPPPTARTRRSQERRLLRAGLDDAEQRRATIRASLEPLSSTYRDLLDAVTDKARRIVRDRKEGWQAVQEVLDGDLADAHLRLEQVERARDLLRDLRTALSRATTALLVMEGDPEGASGAGSHADAARSALITARQRLESVRSALVALGHDPGWRRHPFRLTMPAYGPARNMRRAAHRAARAVGEARRALDRLEHLDQLEDQALEALSEAEDRLIDLMRRPY